MQIPPHPSWLSKRLHDFQIGLARPHALIHLAIIGIFSGLSTGGLIILFRLLVEDLPASFFPQGSTENFEGFSWWVRAILPLGASILLIMLFRWFAKEVTSVGVPSVMERMEYHQGHFQLPGLIKQFFGAAITIVGGFSMGREGPHVYIGASSSSLLGQWLSLPNNSIRILAGCGTAAGIAASFNTPLAGVIFALEVVMMEYTVTSFVPIILAASTATILAVSVYGDALAFSIPSFAETSFKDMPLLLVLGLTIGGLSAALIQSVETGSQLFKKLSLPSKFLLAGLIASVFAIVVPEVMGVGYDTFNQTLLGALSLSTLLILTFAKLAATSFCISLSIPGGMIAPALFIGTTLGAAVGMIGQALGIDIDPAFLALLGMGAMMGASLQAPLAGLTAMMELTQSPGVIGPAMLVIITASITSRQIFNKDSLFVTMYKASGLKLDANPVMQMLRRIGVTSIMNTDIVRSDTMINKEKAEQLLESKPSWIILNDELHQVSILLRAADLSNFLLQEKHNTDFEEIDLLEIPAQRLDIAGIHAQATVGEALEKLDREDLNALYVERQTAPGIHHIFGVLTRRQIEATYQ